MASDREANKEIHTPRPEESDEKVVPEDTAPEKHPSEELEQQTSELDPAQPDGTASTLPDTGGPKIETDDRPDPAEPSTQETTDTSLPIRMSTVTAARPSFWSVLRHRRKFVALLVIAILSMSCGALYLLRSHSAATVPKGRFAAVVTPFRITSTVPTAGQVDVVNTNKIILNFNRPVDPDKLAGDFFVSPLSDGTYSQGANADQVIFTPKVSFAKGTAVKVMIHGEFESQDGSRLGADYSFGFSTATPDNGVVFERAGYIETLGSVHAGTKQLYTILAGDNVSTGNTVTIYSGTVQQLLSSLTYTDQQSGGYTYPDFAQRSVDTAGLSAVTTEPALKNNDTFDFTPDKGVYLLVATNKGEQTGYAWLVASNFGVVLRQDDQQVVFLAEDFASGSTTTANLTMYNLHNGVQQLDELTVDGMTATNLPLKPALDVVVAVRGDDVAVVPVSTYLTLADVRVQKDLSTSDTFYGLTDRPTYATGDTVNYAAFVRADNDASYQVPSGGSLRLYVASSPTGTHYADTTVPIETGGIVHAAFTIGAAAIPEGQTSQQLFVYNGSANNPTDANSPAGAFTVTSSKPSVWRLNVSFAKDSYLANDAVIAMVAGTDDSGAPLAGKKVTTTIYTKNYYEGDMAANLASFGTYGNAVTGMPLDVTLDGNGRASLPIDVSKFPAGSSQVVTVQASATDQDGVTAAGGASTVVHEGNGTLVFGSSRTLVSSGGQITGRIYVRALDGSPLGNAPVVYELSTNQSGAPQKIANGTVTTDSNGFAEIDQAVGNYASGTSLVLTASTADSSGNRISASRYYSVQGANDNVAYSDVQLADLDIYGTPSDVQIGQNLSLVVDAPQAVNALMTTERGRIHSYKLVSLKQGKNNLPLSVGVDLAPSFSLIFSYFQNGAYHSEGVTFTVMPSSKQAKVQLTTPLSVQAGHTTVANIKTTDASGQPQSSSVIFGAVSANVYDLNSQVTPSIFDYLYGSRDITTNASSSLTGIGSGGGKCGGGWFDQPALLNPLGATASWQPSLTTNATGMVSVPLQLPKGTWRLYAYTMSNDSLVGSSYTTVTAQ